MVVSICRSLRCESTGTHTANSANRRDPIWPCKCVGAASRRRNVHVMLTRGTGAYREHCEPQWIKLPYHAHTDPAPTTRGRAHDMSKRNTVARLVASVVPSLRTSCCSAERICAYSLGRSKFTSSSLSITYMQPFSTVASVTGIHTLTIFGLPRRWPPRASGRDEANQSCHPGMPCAWCESQVRLAVPRERR
jgi:hypothetical protein